MTQQDYTAPQFPCKASRKERFQHIFQVFQSAETPDGIGPAEDLTGYQFGLQVFDRGGVKKLALTEADGLTRPSVHAVMVTISTAQMGALGTGLVRAELFGVKGGEREDFVHLMLTLE